ncbi:MAG: VCBS repeat-containing protein [Polyangiaceae bacterium]|nr:VCBS repeat-containing protein [Polyangiaceae bacterium]
MPTDTPPASAATRMGDVDGDGDLDIFAADGYAQGSGVVGRLYVNNGQGAFEEAVGAIPNSIDGQDIDDVEFADVDRDFDLDLLVNAHSGGAGALWLNDGQGTFAAGGTLAPPGPGSQFHYNVTPCDVDGDGDLDLWVDNVGGNYTEQLQINDGDGNFTDETSSRVTGNAAGSDDNGVICADIDDDGDFDAVVIALGSPERLLQNDGAGSFTFVANAFPGPTNCSLWGEMGDLNGDDRLDLVTGQGECSSSDEVYLGNDQMPVDAKPPVIVAVRPMPSVEQGSVAAAQFAVSDRTVTDEGPRLARAYAVLDPAGAATEIPATFMGGDLFRAEVPAAALGTFTFRACAVDPAGNETCSTDQSYTVVEDTGEGGGGAGMGGASNAGGNGNGGANGPGGGSANGGGGGAIDDGGGSGDGCDCGLAKQTTRSPWAILSLIGTAIALRARRRRR